MNAGKKIHRERITEKAREVGNGANVDLDGGVGEWAVGEKRTVENEGTFRQWKGGETVG